jgi:hypothetical protein
MKLDTETQNWEQLDNVGKLITIGRLEMLKEVQEILEGFQESYTRELVVNGIKDEEAVAKFINGINIKLNPPPAVKKEEISFVGDSGDEEEN